MLIPHENKQVYYNIDDDSMGASEGAHKGLSYLLTAQPHNLNTGTETNHLVVGDHPRRLSSSISRGSACRAYVTRNEEGRSVVIVSHGGVGSQVGVTQHVSLKDRS